MVIKIINQSTPSNDQKEDAFSKLVGHFGKWQFIVFSSVFMVKLSSGWVQLAILFLTPNLTFYCMEFSLNNTVVVQNSTCYEDCLKYEYDTSPFDKTIVSEWDLICERKWMASFTQTVLQLGIAVGSLLFGFFSDRYGRKYTFLAAVTMLIAFGFGIPFSPNYFIFTLQRFFLGIASAGTMVVSFVIVMETLGPKYRDILACVFQIPFVLGHLTLPLFAYYFRSWDSYSLALAIPPLIYLGYFFLLSETPRWLVSVGKVKEATNIVTKAALMNNLPTAKIEETLMKISNEISARSGEIKYNYLDLFKKSLCFKTSCLTFAWMIAGLTFFGVNQYISQTSPDPFVSVAAAAAIQIPADLITYFLIKHFGRKKTVATFFCLTGISIIALGYVPNKFWIILTIGTLGVSFTSIVATSIYIFTSELYPTVVRNMGLGACSLTMRIGSMVAPFVSNLSSTAPWLPTVILGLAPISAGLICLLLPETKGKALADSLDEIKTKR